MSNSTQSPKIGSGSGWGTWFTFGIHFLLCSISQTNGFNILKEIFYDINRIFRNSRKLWILVENIIFTIFSFKLLCFPFVLKAACYLPAIINTGIAVQYSALSSKSRVFIDIVGIFNLAFKQVFNARNKSLTAKLLQQGYRYHKLRKTFSKFYRRHYELVSKFNVGLKTLLHQGLSEPEFYGDLVYKFKKIVGRVDFCDQFRKIIVRYKRIGYNINIMRQSACLVFNPITVNNFASLFNCTPVGRASDSMMAPT